MHAQGYTVDLFKDHYEHFDPTMDGCDAFVHFDDGGKYVATCFTLEGTKAVMKKDETTGDTAGGTYFWCSDLLILRRVDQSNLNMAVESLLVNGEFEEVFSLCEPDEPGQPKA